MVRAFVVFGSILVCLVHLSSSLGEDPSPAAKQSKRSRQTTISHELHNLFVQLDALGRDQVKDAKCVELHLSNAQMPWIRINVKAWLISEDEQTITVLMKDLLPRIYQKKSATTVPCSWHPVSYQLDSMTDASFEDLCKELIEQGATIKDDAKYLLEEPSPSCRLLVAHAAWKRGLSDYCVPLLENEPDYKDNFQKYRAAVLDDLAWLHFLRGVNLLMFADRREVLPHLRLVKELSPEGKYAAQAEDLLERLQRVIADQKTRSTLDSDISKLSDTELAKLYVSQLPDLCCPQRSQPGFINPYLSNVTGKPDERLPTCRLKILDMAAVPALIDALEDDTPTRTVYHWRDFHRSRVVWRVSDFAWSILCDIAKEEFGNKKIIGYTFNWKTPEAKHEVIKEIRDWYAANNTLSVEDRMFNLFSSKNSYDWLKASQYFLLKKNKRAVKPLLENIPRAQPFIMGRLCELAAQFGDPRTKEVIRTVMHTAKEPSDRLTAAILLWSLGDQSGVPMVIDYVKAEKQPYEHWDTPVWFLMRVRSQQAIDTLEAVVKNAPPERAAEVLFAIMESIGGNLIEQQREPAGCVEICPILMAGMERSEYTGGCFNKAKQRVQDFAAKAFVLLTTRKKGLYGISAIIVDPKLFDDKQPDEAKRDAQIQSLKDWYEKNKDKLFWDSQSQRLVVKQD